jgi:pimeloyl-ACP methyl ester carboxylesterase
MSAKAFLGIVFALVTLLSLAGAQAQAENPLPAPTGPYDVGVVWRHWTDEGRDEPDDEAPDAKREVIVEFLYPAEVTANAERAPYIDNRDQVIPTFAALLEGFAGFPVNTQPSDLDDFQSYAYPNAALSDDEASYPVLIFSHGGGADVRMYSAQIEELASHGYMVAAINHAYGAAITELSDGRVVYTVYSAGLEGAAPVWSQDQIFVMDQLEILNADDPEGLFTNRLDLERIGVFGQSVGGAATTITCFVDARCKAGANGDGPVYGDVIEQGLDQPFLYLLSDTRIFFNPAFYAQARGPVYEVAVAGFEHLNIGDFPLWPHVDSVIEAGWLSDTDGVRSVELTRAALVAFFDIYLKGNEGSLSDALNTYAEMTITGHNIETA